MKTNYSPLKLRTCLDCHRSGFAECLNKVGVRHYRHSDKWKARCEWFIATPNATLSDAKATNLIGVARDQ